MGFGKGSIRGKGNADGGMVFGGDVGRMGRRRRAGQVVGARRGRGKRAWWCGVGGVTQASPNNGREGSRQQATDGQLRERKKSGCHL